MKWSFLFLQDWIRYKGRRFEFLERKNDTKSFSHLYVSKLRYSAVVKKERFLYVCIPRFGISNENVKEFHRTLRRDYSLHAWVRNKLFMMTQLWHKLLLIKALFVKNILDLRGWVIQNIREYSPTHTDVSFCSRTLAHRTEIAGCNVGIWIQSMT